MTETAPHKSAPTWLKLLIDYGPVLAFFISYRLLRPAHSDQSIGEVLAVTKSTLVFVIATVIAVILSKWRLGRVEPMLWLTAVLVCGFGALTVYTQDQRWIRHKPTAVYALFSAVLFWGLWRGKPLLKTLLASAFEGLSDEGWFKLSRNWAIFFVCLALLNEGFANSDWFTFDQWLRAKLVVFMPLSLIFTFAHVPMLMRHGLGVNNSTDENAAE